MENASNQYDNENLICKIVTENLLKYIAQHGDELQKEAEQFVKDKEKYNHGVLLWFKEDYPHFCEYFEIFINIKNPLNFDVLKGMKFVISNYNKLIADVKRSTPELFKEELSISKENVFDKTIKPIDMLLKKDPFTNYASNVLNKNINSYTEPIVDLVKRIVPEIENIFKLINEKSLELIFRQLELFIQNYKSVSDGALLEASLKHMLESVKTYKKEKEEESKNLTIKIKSELQKHKKETQNNLENIQTASKLISDVYTLDATATIRDYLDYAEKLDSFNIMFVKYINRLFHILKYNDKNFKKHCQIGEYTHKERFYLKNFVSKALKKDYPHLARFLLKSFKLNKYRRVKAHENPEKIEISEDKKKAFISTVGSTRDIEMDIDEIKTLVFTYCFFIDALDL